jgi:FRG domain-containing protein
MNGQWIGTYSGTNSGLLVADLDDAGTNYQGIVSAYDDNWGLPRTFAHIEVPKGQTQYSTRVTLQHIERGSGLSLSDAAVAGRFPEVSIPKHADVQLAVGPNSMSITWKSDIGTTASGELFKSAGGKPSTLKPMPEVKSWRDFSEFVRTLTPYQYLFRGHSNNQWRLRTSFHRTGRASLLKFHTQDVESLHRHLSGLTTHRFNLDDPLDYAAFLNLAQHHGYPTPLLDWTQSPFVGAYFAFRHLRPQINSDEKVRIFVLDGRAWASSLERGGFLMPGFLHMTVLEPLAINNPRALPQQSVSTVTNVDDLDLFIEDKIEKRFQRSYLRVIDLPATERRQAMQDLARMGITAGSMFPGLDGACQQLKERFFDL